MLQSRVYNTLIGKGEDWARSNDRVIIRFSTQKSQGFGGFGIHCLIYFCNSTSLFFASSTSSIPGGFSVTLFIVFDLGFL
jgi:hypothetical protein